MNRLTRLCLGLITPALLLNTSQVNAADAAHEHHHTAANAVVADDHGKLWGTDQALRDGMTQIRAALADKMEAIHHNSLNNDGYATLASALESALAGIFAHCKLPPAADAQLHTILLPMSAAVEHMKQAPALAERHDAALKVINGLKDYGKVFDHPGWQPLESGERP